MFEQRLDLLRPGKTAVLIFCFPDARVGGFEPCATEHCVHIVGESNENIDPRSMWLEAYDR